jgi:hypothetical protein
MLVTTEDRSVSQWPSKKKGWSSLGIFLFIRFRLAKVSFLEDLQVRWIIHEMVAMLDKSVEVSFEVFLIQILQHS